MTSKMSASRDNAVTVSAVMPSYNTAAYLPSAIDSILNQTFSDWELLIVDDGSTDDTASVLARYTDPRITVQTLPVNRGRSAAAADFGTEAADGPRESSHSITTA